MLNRERKSGLISVVICWAEGAFYGNWHDLKGCPPHDAGDFMHLATMVVAMYRGDVAIYARILVGHWMCGNSRPHSCGAWAIGIYSYNLCLAAHRSIQALSGDPKGKIIHKMIEICVWICLNAIRLCGWRLRWQTTELKAVVHISSCILQPFLSGAAASLYVKFTIETISGSCPMKSTKVQCGLMTSSIFGVSIRGML